MKAEAVQTDNFLVFRDVDIQNICGIFEGLGLRFDIGKITSIAAPTMVAGSNNLRSSLPRTKFQLSLFKLHAMISPSYSLPRRRRGDIAEKFSVRRNKLETKSTRTGNLGIPLAGPPASRAGTRREEPPPGGLFR
jgi:hypothetical protein